LVKEELNSAYNLALSAERKKLRPLKSPYETTAMAMA